MFYYALGAATNNSVPTTSQNLWKHGNRLLHGFHSQQSHRNRTDSLGSKAHLSAHLALPIDEMKAKPGAPKTDPAQAIRTVDVNLHPSVE